MSERSTAEFILHLQQYDANGGTSPLTDPRQQAVNQAAMRLVSTGDGPPELILYTLGVLLSKSRQYADADRITALGHELAELMQQGVMGQAFGQLPQIDRWKMAAMQALSHGELNASLDPQKGMALALNLNEISVLSPRYLQEMLTALEQEPRLAAFMQSHRRVFINALLYRFYHHGFPGAEEAEWEPQYGRICQQHFSLKMLCALFIRHELTLDDMTLNALFVAGQQMADVAIGDSPLLVGISLLK